MRNILACAIATLSIAASPSVFAQGKKVQKPNQSSQKAQYFSRPRLVVGMVVDQMSWEYLYRFNSRFGQSGFRRLLDEGFNCDNARINYLPSVTAIGHSTVYTGSVPSLHGIAGNNFYDNGKPMYCTEDKSVQTVGAENGKDGQMSPRNLRATTITDELRIATNFTSRVVGVALKDRGAILPAGHAANAAYWFDDKSGNFISSTYYMDKLPQWVNDFNSKRLPEQYLAGGWQPLYPLNTYTESVSDQNKYEQPWGDVPATLPLDTKALSQKHGVGVIRSTPMGNELTLDMAKAAIEGESLGMRKDSTDFLAISLSSTDYVGHRYGTFSVELEDTYLRLDRQLASFFSYLDSKYGKDGYVFFITADHAAGHNIQFLADKHLPGDKWRVDETKKLVDSVSRSISGQNVTLLKDVMNYQIFFNEQRIDSLGIDRDKLYNAVVSAVSKQEGVAYAVRGDKVNPTTLPTEIAMRITNGYNRTRSGAIFVVTLPGYMSAGSKPVLGTNHAVWSPYDTHIPLIFMGHNVPKGHLYREVYMTDIAATLAFLLKTQLPSACIGKPITEMLK